MRIERPGLVRAAELPEPAPGPGQLLIRVHACAVCRTDLHLLDGEVSIPHPPIVPGHQIVGTVLARGEPLDEPEDVAAPLPGRSLEIGERVGVPWLGWTDGSCRYCRSGRENLCERGLFTGRDIDGGYAELTVADERYCFPLPEGYSDLEAAPLLCAGLIGYRALRLTGEARGADGEPQRLGLYGFGSAALLIAQVARFQGRRVFAFTRPGDEEGQAFAREQGAEWAGGSLTRPPEELDGAIIFASVGELVPAALRASAPGGVVVCAGIHMSDIPSFPYEILWGERQIRSVANLTRRDGQELLELAPLVPIRTEVTPYPLAALPEALEDFRHGRLRGTAVIELAAV
jgi:propanol-preferring alcohol dehydrogenase